MKFCITSVLFFLCISTSAQQDYWQQRINYKMNIDVNVSDNTFIGRQQIQYINNSPDTLTKIYFHLYWNAFRPGSLMDERSRSLGNNIFKGKPDWDPRVTDRISKLKENEMGLMQIDTILINGKLQKCTKKFDGTILEVLLTEPILPHQQKDIHIFFNAQVPLQIRRSGRDNPQTGVQYSMSQWYPKLCEYDRDGWDATPYVAREFYGVWGDYDVTIAMREDYKIGATGTLQNADEVGWGYDMPNTELKPLTTDTNIRYWHFKADNVHDFVWAADTAYKHLVRTTQDGILLHTIYKYEPNDTLYDANWSKLADVTIAVFPFIEKTFGKYLYPQYSFIQGGDGGMEYPMATLIKSSSLGTAFHEWMHSWYQMMLATNESLYPWMDEGFTEFASSRVQYYYYENIMRKQANDSLAVNHIDSLLATLPRYHSSEYESYYKLVKSNLEEPLTTHADHYNTNAAYGASVYSKGCLFLSQLGYIVGDSLRDKILMIYYDQWKLKHPRPEDFMHIAEKISGIELDWFKEYWIHTTKHIDYAIDSVSIADNKTLTIQLSRKDEMPMPLDVVIYTKKGNKFLYCIPLDLMMDSKKNDEAYDNSCELHTAKTWQWANRNYSLETTIKFSDVSKIEIDPTQRMADIDRSNNIRLMK